MILNMACHSAVVEDHGMNDNSVIVMGECGQRLHKTVTR